MAAERVDFFFIFVCNIEARMRVTHRTYNKGSRRQEGQEREGKNSGEQRHEICGRDRDGVGVHRQNKMDTTGTFRKEYHIHTVVAKNIGTRALFSNNAPFLQENCCN